MKKIKKLTPKELAEAYIFPSELSEIERAKADEEFSAFIKRRRLQMTDEERLYSQVIQLKYIMEDYLSGNSYKKEYTFGHFLREYIHLSRKKEIHFAGEINLHYTQLSRLLNDREIPGEKILVRLEIHSNNLIPALLWYRILEKQKQQVFITNKGLRKTELKNVRNRLKLS